MAHWNWLNFKGSEACLKWSRRDLETLKKALRYVPGRTCCIQAGGNLGIFPKKLAEEFSVVYAFEPHPMLFSAMSQNAPEPNIRKIRAALGANNKPVRMACKRRDKSGRPVHEGLTHVAGPGTIPCMRIDDLKLPVCDLIYLDIEGYEYFALQGAAETIARCRPVIGVEVNRNIAFTGHTADELRTLILSAGYVHRLTSHSDEIYTPC